MCDQAAGERLWLDHGGAGRVVLVVAFEATRGQAGAAELAAGLTGFRVLSLRPEEDTGALPTRAAAAQAPARWLSALDDVLAGGEVAAVVGHCAGVAVAVHLVDGLRELGRRTPAVVLLDPAPVDAGTLLSAFDVALGVVEDHLLDDEQAAARAARASVAAFPAAQVDQLAATLVTAYSGASDAVTARWGVAEDMRAQLRQRFMTYLAFLLAAALANGRQPAGRSQTQVVTVRSSAASGGGPRAGGEVRVDVVAAELLAHPQVAALVRGAAAAEVTS